MNTATRSDASTSTDDVKGRPLCLFYFTHPFAVLSPEAPCVYDMESAPPPPFCWPPPPPASDSYRSSSPTPPAAAPVGRRAPPLPDSLSSSETWSAAGGGGRRYARILPPLRVPSPRDLVDYSSDDVWPRRPLAARFSLPPLVLPAAPHPALPPPPPAPPLELRARRPRPFPAGVDQHRRRHRRARAGDLRRLLATLIRRTIIEGRECRESSASASASCSPAPALRRALHTLRNAWAPSPPSPASPTSPSHCRRAVCSNKSVTSKMSRNPESAGMSRARARAPGGAGRADASPGLLRRRYSVPETIMRKYRLAQQYSESEEGTSCARRSAGSASESPRRERGARRDRELMRKSALLRRLWAGGGRPPACACCEARSDTELRRSPLAWTSPERRRLDRLATAADTSALHSDSTFESHAGDACSCTDAFTDSEPPPPLVSDDRSYSDSDPFSTSLSTAKETAARPLERFVSESVERRVFERPTFDNGNVRNPGPYDRPLAVDTTAPPFELLEIVVSESTNGVGAQPPAPPAESADTGRTASSAPDLDIDRYVSNILVESLNSLTDQLECMNASIGNDRKISIVEKQIKVRLQNTGVNTIVHLSPTSNNQIIFGNEELCNEMTTTMSTVSRDECNNPVIRDEVEPRSPPAPAPAPAPPAGPLAFDALQHDSVNEAVLQQIQKLFRDELRHLDDDDDDDTYGRAADAISHIEISNVVDVYVERRTAADLIGGVGAGNYFDGSHDAAVVPRFSAFPHTESMEVNTSSSEDVELAGSECTSLVDSLDDPNSPRGLGLGGAAATGVTSARRRALVRSAIDVLDLLPEREPGPEPEHEPEPARDKPEAFFVRIEDDRVEPDPDDVRVAEYMPEKIKQRLYRRHRKRELRMECARRGKNQLKREIELRRREDAAVAARRCLDRDCRAFVDELLDDLIAKIVHDEFKCTRIKRRSRLQVAKSDDTLSRRTRRVSLDSRRTSSEAATEERCRRVRDRGRSDRDGSTGDTVQTERHQVHGKLHARPSASLATRPPRRFYQKSEIHEGDKCIEILEILEYVNGSQSSPETANSDESQGRGSRSKKSRIPVPVCERSYHRTIDSEHMRLTGGDGRRRRVAAAGPDEAFAELLLEALADGPAGAEPRSRSSSVRFKRVFDIIPEERSSLSPASGEERGSRSAATSPAAGPAAPRRLRHQVTMTSPYNKSAGTSPMRPPPPREGYREVGVGPIESPASPASPASPGAVRRELVDGDLNEKRDEATATGERGRGKNERSEKPERDEPSGPIRTRDELPDRESADDVKMNREDTGARRDRQRATPRRRRGPPAPEGDSSDSGDSGGSLLCSLAPRWLSSQARRDRRRPRRAPLPAPRPAPSDDVPVADAQLPSGGWSVTVAGSCRAALPHDVEMRLRFPHAERPAPAPAPAPSPARCACVQCAACSAAASRAPRPALPLPPTPHNDRDPKLTLTMKKEAQDSSIVASKTSRRSREHLPELETYRASRTKVKSSMKTRRGYSLHCWLPEDEPAPIRGSSGLSVLGCAIIPELKPRVPTMSERDLTRVYTPRHYLRS